MGNKTPERALITKVIEFDAGHRVPTHDGKCRCPHGHRYRIEATFEGPVPESGMVVDFSLLKNLMTRAVHDVYDHKFIVWDQDEPMLAALRHFAIASSLGGHVVVDYVPTAENLAAAFAADIIEALLVEGYSARLHCLRLFETPNSWADYFNPNQELL